MVVPGKNRKGRYPRTGVLANWRTGKAADWRKGEQAYRRMGERAGRPGRPQVRRRHGGAGNDQVLILSFVSSPLSVVSGLSLATDVKGPLTKEK